MDIGWQQFLEGEATASYVTMTTMAGGGFWGGAGVLIGVSGAWGHWLLGNFSWLQWERV